MRRKVRRRNQWGRGERLLKAQLKHYDNMNFHSNNCEGVKKYTNNLYDVLFMELERSNGNTREKSE